jgi:hypothetical protein
MPTQEDLLLQIADIAAEQLRWQRASALPQVRQTVDETLTTSQLRRAFEVCDGERQGQDIANTLGVSKQSFSGWTRRWRDLGIAFETPDRRIKHLVSLRSLGLPLEVREKKGQGQRDTGRT